MAEVVERFRSAGSALDLGSLLAELWMVTDAAEQLALADEVVALGAAARLGEPRGVRPAAAVANLMRTGQARLNEPSPNASLGSSRKPPISARLAVAQLVGHPGDRHRPVQARRRSARPDARLPCTSGRRRRLEATGLAGAVADRQSGAAYRVPAQRPSAITYAVRAASATWSIAGLDHRWLGGCAARPPGRTPRRSSTCRRRACDRWFGAPRARARRGLPRRQRRPWAIAGGSRRLAR